MMYRIKMERSQYNLIEGRVTIASPKANGMLQRKKDHRSPAPKPWLIPMLNIATSPEVAKQTAATTNTHIRRDVLVVFFEVSAMSCKLVNFPGPSKATFSVNFHFIPDLLVALVKSQLAADSPADWVPAVLATILYYLSAADQIDRQRFDHCSRLLAEPRLSRKQETCHALQ